MMEEGFQFLIGRLKTPEIQKQSQDLEALFQFLIGRLKTMTYPELVGELHKGFNSS